MQLHAKDNIAVALVELAQNTPIPFDGVVTLAPIPAGHKIAIQPIPAGNLVRKYGQVIGSASDPIAPGEQVHTHNLKMGFFQRDNGFGEDAKGNNLVPEAERVTFAQGRR